MRYGDLSIGSATLPALILTPGLIPVTLAPRRLMDEYVNLHWRYNLPGHCALVDDSATTRPRTAVCVRNTAVEVARPDMPSAGYREVLG